MALHAVEHNHNIQVDPNNQMLTMDMAMINPKTLLVMKWWEITNRATHNNHIKIMMGYINKGEIMRCKELEILTIKDRVLQTGKNNKDHLNGKTKIIWSNRSLVKMIRCLKTIGKIIKTTRKTN